MYGSQSGQKQAMEYWVLDGKNNIDYLRANNWGPTLTLTKVFQSKVFKEAEGRVWLCKIHLAYKINIRKTLASQILLLSIHPSFRPPPWYGNHSIFMWRTNHKLVFPQAECLVKSQDKCLLKWLRGSTKEAAPETCMQSFYPYIHYAVLHYIAWALPRFYIKNAAL